MATPGRLEAVITGVGLFTAVGKDATQSASSVRAGITRFSPWPHFGLTFGEDSLVAAFTAPDLRDGSWTEKVSELLEPPLVEALFAADLLAGTAGPRIHLVLATPYPNRPATDEGAMNEVAEELREDLASTLGIGSAEVVALDHAGGLAALARGVAALQAGTCDVCVVAGVDSFLHADFLMDLLGRRRLRTPVNQGGLIPGEGAAALVLESADGARRRGVRVLARLGSVSLDREPHELRPEEGLRAEALSRSLQGALAAVDPGMIKRVIVDLNGERWRFLEWALAETRCLDRLPVGWQLWHPADCWGDLGAASGVAHVALAVRAFARRYGGDGGILVCSSSTGGERAAATILNPVSPQGGA